jgi:hypothetical protein
MNLAANLDQTASRTPDNVALVFEGAEITFGQLRARALGAADVLAARGVGAGDRVALWLPNHPAFASVMYGAWRLGATVVPVHSALTPGEAKHILTDSGANVVVCGPDQREAGAKLADAVGLEEFPLEGSDRALAQTSGGDLALIQYTAGTSGVPKGAMLTHGNLHANIEQMRQLPIAISPDDVALCVLPLFHIFGLNVVLNLAIEVGAKIVLSERFDANGALDLIKAHLVTMIAGAPPVYNAWLSIGAPPDSFSNVRAADPGPAPTLHRGRDAGEDRGVAGAPHQPRAHHHRLEAIPVGGAHGVLGLGLGGRVERGGVGSQRRVLVHLHKRLPGQQRGLGAHVHEAAHPRRGAGFQRVCGAQHVAALEVLTTAPFAQGRSGVEGGVASGGPAAHGLHVIQFAAHRLGA